MPDSGQEHTADSDDGFLVAAACFYAAISAGYLGMLFRLDQSICNLYQNWFNIGTSTGNPGRFDLTIALVIAGAASGP